MDTLSPAQRSQLMSRVKGRNTKPELRVRCIAHAIGLRFRLGRRDLPGSPDLVLPRHRLAVFVHGCFWHRHPGCRRASFPQTRPEYWRDKFDKNIARDHDALLHLEKLGWRSLVLWECEVKDAFEVAIKLKSAVSRDSEGAN